MGQSEKLKPCSTWEASLINSNLLCRRNQLIWLTWIYFIREPLSSTMTYRTYWIIIWVGHLLVSIKSILLFFFPLKRGDDQVSDQVKPALYRLSCCHFHILNETLSFNICHLYTPNSLCGCILKAFNFLPLSLASLYEQRYIKVCISCIHGCL